MTPVYTTWRTEVWFHSVLDVGWRIYLQKKCYWSTGVTMVQQNRSRWIKIWRVLKSLCFQKSFKCFSFLCFQSKHFISVLWSFCFWYFTVRIFWASLWQMRLLCTDSGNFNTRRMTEEDFCFHFTFWNNANLWKSVDINSNKSRSGIQVSLFWVLQSHSSESTALSNDLWGWHKRE